MSQKASLRPDYFDALYARDPDPWRFATSEYERDKYAHSVAALPRARYASGLEVGCSIGVLTRALAARCDRLLAVDVAEAALDQARARNADLAHVVHRRLRLPDEAVPGTYDLVVLSEVLYYFDAADLAQVADRVRAAARPGADLLLVHWLPRTDYPLTGDEAAEGFIRHLGGAAEVLAGERRERYRLDLLRLA